MKKMTGKKLDIEKITDERFGKWKEQFLDGKVLSDQALHEIKQAFDLDPRTTETVSITCDEAHRHNWSCLDFSNRYSAVVLRLINEIEDYRARFNEIMQKADYKK